MSRGTAKDVATVVAAAGEIVGKTRLQKTVVLLELTGLGFGFNYHYYLFGPFSDDLVVSAERAAALGYVREEARRAKWGGIYCVYRAAQQSSGDVRRDQIVAVARDADSIVLELAATAAYLAACGNVEPWREVELRKPEKVTRARLTKAKELYRKIAEVDTPRKLPLV